MEIFILNVFICVYMINVNIFESHFICNGLCLILCLGLVMLCHFVVDVIINGCSYELP